MSGELSFRLEFGQQVGRPTLPYRHLKNEYTAGRAFQQERVTQNPDPIQHTQQRLQDDAKDEEEDSWISGEELYTEGSSDDEAGGHTHAHPHAHTHTHTRSPASAPPPASTTPEALKSPGQRPLPTTPSAASEPALQSDPHLTETTRRLSLMGLEQVGAAAQGSTTQAEEVEEQEEVMLWRPKRGSIKLPHIDLDPPAPALLSQVSG
ncbi:hypothetical protein GWK47_026312 [Chionoecetes opilio]|uniref:Uncharacterized protein n=1 Tax=Chionoecetes opilio TaxID=41210 RepID=A0A8J8WAH1_CHIOP|nr:hypothetical protein GWK47_026312 [Chionoecetes opilio]